MFFGHSQDSAALARVGVLIEERFKVSYEISGVWRLLDRLGWSWQVPKVRAVERNEERVCPLVGRCSAARPAQTPSARVYGEESWDWGGAGSGERPRRRAAAVVACWVNSAQARRRGSWPGHGAGDVPGVGRSDSPCMREASPVAAER